MVGLAWPAAGLAVLQGGQATSWGCPMAPPVRVRVLTLAQSSPSGPTTESLCSCAALKSRLSCQIEPFLSWADRGDACPAPNGWSFVSYFPAWSRLRSCPGLLDPSSWTRASYCLKRPLRSSTYFRSETWRIDAEFGGGSCRFGGRGRVPPLPREREPMFHLPRQEPKSKRGRCLARVPEADPLGSPRH